MQTQKSLRILLHHCEGGQWFYYFDNLYFSGTYGMETRDFKFAVAGSGPEKRICRICGKTAAQMEEENAEIIAKA